MSAVSAELLKVRTTKAWWGILIGAVVWVGGLSALAAAFRASGAQLVCLCSSDEVYADQAAAAVQAFHAEGARHIYLAGRPGGQEAALRAAGVQDFIFPGGDALAVLNDAWRRLEQR